MKSAIDIAKFFIRKKLDTPRNKYDGNMKLQKLLYFAQLIHLEMYDDVLFEDNIRAFENGPVVECVRKRYKEDHNAFVKEAYNSEYNFGEKVKNTLETTIELFGDISAKKLSDMTHKHKCWEKALEASKNVNGFYYKNKNIIPVEEMEKEISDNLKEYIKAKELSAEQDDEFEVVNGIKFYYDPNEIDIDQNILNKLENFAGNDEAYTLIKDSSQGLVIF